MGNVRTGLDVCNRALMTLEEILSEPYSVIVRDASLQRFEYTFETAWKLVKSYLYEIEGIDCASPKGCFRQALKTGILTEKEAEHALVMCND